MAALLETLTFIETDESGKEFHKLFPAGTPITESRECADSRWSEEVKLCEGRVFDFARRGDKGYYVFFLGGRPRLIHRRFWDVTFQQERQLKEHCLNYGVQAVAQEKKTAIATDERAIEGGMPRSVLDDGDSSLVGCNGSLSGARDAVEADSQGSGNTDRFQPGEHLPKLRTETETGAEMYVTESPSPLGSEPFAQYGLVVIVDLMNLLVRAFHAGTPSKIHAVKSLLQTCANVIEKLSPEYLIFAADGGHAMRSELFPAYKAHRPPKAPELVAQIELAEKAIEALGWPIIRVVDWEADDVIASLVAKLSDRAAGCVVCSCDKDLLQLCDGTRRVKIYHPWDKGLYIGGSHVEEKYSVKREQFKHYLSLCGDSSDGVPGVKGVGPKKAAELLGKYPNLEAILEAARCLLIPGAAGKALRDQAEEARMSAKLIELEYDLEIPFTWHDYPASSPSAGWVDALRALDLGQVVQRLTDVIPQNGRVRSGSSKIEVTNEHSDGNTACDDSASQAGNIVERETQPMADRMPSHDGSVVCSTVSDSVGTVSELLPPAVLGGSESVRVPNWVQTFPPLARIDPKNTADCQKSVYANSYRDRLRGIVRENPWRVDSDYWRFWEAGSAGLDFPDNVTVPDEPEKNHVVPSATTVTSKPHPGQLTFF